MTAFKRFAALCLLMGASFVAHSGTVTYVYTDPQGTPLAEANASGTITATFDYRPYGSQALGSPKVGPGYTGHVNDPDTGFVYMQARYYDPVSAVFLSTDPIPVAAGNIFSFVRYAYVSNNPIMLIDPTGRSQKHPQDSMCSDPFPCDDDPRVVAQRPPSPFGSSPSPSEQRETNPVPDRMIVIGSEIPVDCWQCYVIFKYQLVNTAGSPLTDPDYKVQEHIRPILKIGEPVRAVTSEGTYVKLSGGVGYDYVGLTADGYSKLTKSSHSLDIYRQTFTAIYGSSKNEYALSTVFYHTVEVNGTKVSANTVVMKP